VLMRKIALLIFALLALSCTAQTKPAFAKSFITFVKSLTIKHLEPAHKVAVEVGDSESIELATPVPENLPKPSDLPVDEIMPEHDIPTEKPEVMEVVPETDPSEKPDLPIKLPRNDVDLPEVPLPEDNVITIADDRQIYYTLTQDKEKMPKPSPSSQGTAIDYSPRDWKKCSNVNSLGDYVTCWAGQAGKSIDHQRVARFNKLVVSPYTRQFVKQKFTYRYLPQTAVKSYLPAYFTLLKGKPQSLESRWSQEAVAEVLKCESGFGLKMFTTSDIDKSNGKYFSLHTRFFAYDCRKKNSIKLIVFKGFRTGFWLPRMRTESNEKLIAEYSRDTFIYLIEKHFGSS